MNHYRKELLFIVPTRRAFINITPEVEEFLKESGIRTKGRLDFGPWKQIFYGEFDGRRPKMILVKIIGE
jgi:thiamine phosphate synthase YjbQ (UPF0047 family)